MSAKNKFLSLFSLLFIITAITGCGGGSSNDVSKKPSIIGDIVDNSAWYKAVDPNESIEMRITVPTPNDYWCAPYNDLNAPQRPCTLDDVDGDDDPNDAYKPKIHVIFESDEFSSGNVANASMGKKGKSTRQAPQSSYRVKLDSKTILYKNERTFQFNKHYYDDSRIKNKLFFDTFIEVPNFTSLRTRFVNLVIDGDSYGLFTDIEHEDEIYLVNHGWSRDDNLYKAQNFDFRMSSKFSLDTHGDPLYPEQFDASLEMKAGKNRETLVEMLTKLQKVNDNPSEFQAFFSHYFNRNNYLTWLAINIITSNKDTNSQNFYLLNPKFSDVFYFTPWDYDDVGLDKSKLAKWERGYAYWWDVPLHRAFLSNKQNRSDLDKKIRELRSTYFSDARLQAKVDAYKNVVQPFIEQQPDSDELSLANWEDAVNNVVPQIAKNIEYYREEIGAPMPFWQEVNYNNGTLNINWGRSIDLEGDKIFYKLKIAKDRNMSILVFEDNNISDTPTVDPENIFYTKDINLSSGRYYLKVISQEENNASSYQIAFDIEIDRNNTKYYGVLGFDVQ